MKTTNESQGHVGHEEIAQLAKQIWEREGRQGGKDVEYWLRAEHELFSGRHRTSRSPANAPTAETAASPGTRSEGQGRMGNRKAIHI